MPKTETRKVDTGIIQRGKTYRFTVYMGYDVNGKQIRKTATYQPPEGLTQRKADKLAKEEYVNFCNRSKGLSNLKESMRFSELVEEYFRLYAPTLKEITAYNYKNHIEYHFMDYFGNRKLKDITPAVITDFFATHKSMVKGDMKTLSPNHAKQIYTVMRSLFTFAVKQEYIKESPCRNIILPQDKSNDEEKKNYLSADELSDFLELFKGYSQFNTIIKTLLYTGMRAGECLGLMWEDIDFDNRKIHIHHTLASVGDKKYLTTPKTKTSNRYQIINDTLYDLLKKHRTEQRKVQLAIGADYKHPEMVFTSDTGDYKDRSSLYGSFKNRLKGTEFKFMTLHMLRHSNATLLLNSGMDLKVISEHLGHANIKVTADVYTVVLDDTRRKTADKIEEILTEKTPNKHQNQKSG